MSEPAFRLEALRGQDRESFSCGVEPLDRYLKRQASQDARRRVRACFVAVEASSGRVVGYYTLSGSGLPLSGFPEEIARRLPRYPTVPVARVGRLAVDASQRGRGLGAALLFDAASRAARSDVAVFGLLVDSKSDEASAFYRHLGFCPVPDGDGQFVIPIATLLAVLS